MGFWILGKLTLYLGEGAGALAAEPGWMHVELTQHSELWVHKLRYRKIIQGLFDSNMAGLEKEIIVCGNQS